MFGLFGSALEVALGLSFVYFVLSLICSHINELLAGLFKTRARNLVRGITNLVCDPAVAEAILRHPLIKALGSDNAEARPVRWLARPIWAGRPSYIPARTFALALFETLAPATEGPVTVERLRCRALALANGIVADVQAQIQQLPPSLEARAQLLAVAAPGRTIDEVRAGVQELAEKGGRQAAAVLAFIDNRQAIGKAMLSLIAQSVSPGTVLVTVDDIRQLLQRLPDSADKDQVASAIDPTATLDSIRKSVMLMPESAARRAVLSAIDSGQATLEAVRASVERWYDSAMERVSGVYKRRVQLWLLAIAALVTFTLGADTLQMMATFANNSAARAAAGAQAIQAAKPGAQSESAPSTAELVNTLVDIKVPFGYGDSPPFGSAGWWLWLGAKVPGLLITTLAVSLGAPFWFDVLQKFTNIRAAGQRPKQASTEAQSTTGSG